MKLGVTAAKSEAKCPLRGAGLMTFPESTRVKPDMDI